MPFSSLHPMSDTLSQPGLESLPKSFEPAALEAHWGPEWERRGYARAGARGTGLPKEEAASFAIQLPPPTPLPAGVAFIKVDDARRALALAAAKFFSRQPRVIAAVTGTSGKTSVAAFVRQIWTALGHAAELVDRAGVARSVVRLGRHDDQARDGRPGDLDRHPALVRSGVDQDQRPLVGGARQPRDHHLGAGGRGRGHGPHRGHRRRRGANPDGSFSPDGGPSSRHGPVGR